MSEVKPGLTHCCQLYVFLLGYAVILSPRKRIIPVVTPAITCQRSFYGRPSFDSQCNLYLILSLSDATIPILDQRSLNNKNRMDSGLAYINSLFKREVFLNVLIVNLTQTKTRSRKQNS